MSKKKLKDGLENAKRHAGGDNGPPPPDDGGPGRPALPCPVTALGKSGDVLWYLSPSGEVVGLHIDDHSHKRLTLLFEGQTAWCYDVAAPERKGGLWRVDQVVEYLVRESRHAGVFNFARQVRGPGAWRLDDGRLALHLGDEIKIYDGAKIETLKAGRKIGVHIYAAAEPEPRPAEDLDGSIERVDDFIEALRSWNWKRADGDPQLVAGWIGAAMVCGALKFRPHIWITGDASSGKSTLEKRITALLGGDGAVLRAADATRASIGSKLNGASRPVLLDEFEPRVGSDRTSAVIDIARLASTEDQAGVMRGSPSGRTIEYAIRAAFLFSSINPIPLNRADMGRIVTLDLLPLSRPNDPAMADHLNRIKAYGPWLRARMAHGFARFETNIRMVREALPLDERGRIGDLLGTLLAAYYTLVEDRPLTMAEASVLLKPYDTDAMIGTTESLDHNECAIRLLSSTAQIEATEGGRWNRTIGSMIRDDIDKRHSDGRGPNFRVLGTHGLRVDYMRLEHGLEGPIVAVLKVANRGKMIESVFANTRWAGVWGRSLLRFPGAFAGGPTNFAGTNQRCVVVPVSSLPMDNVDEPPVEMPPHDAKL